MIDIETLTNRLKSAMKSLLDSSKSKPDYTLIIETDFEHEKHRSKLDDRDPNMNYCSSDQDTFDLQTCLGLQVEIEAAIRESCAKEIHCQMILPNDLVTRVAQDVMRMSIAEPCGVRGCAIYITLQEKEKSHKLATIFGNPSTPPTFEIHLTLREDNRGWKKFQKVFYTIKGCILNSQWTAMPKILCSAYQLEKRRLYRRSGSRESIASHCN